MGETGKPQVAGVTSSPDPDPNPGRKGERSGAEDEYWEPRMWLTSPAVCVHLPKEPLWQLLEIPFTYKDRIPRPYPSP